MNKKPEIAFVGFDEDEDRVWADRVIDTLNDISQAEQVEITPTAKRRVWLATCNGFEAEHWPLAAMSAAPNIEKIDLIVLCYRQAQSRMGAQTGSRRSSASLYRLLDSIYESSFPAIAVVDDIRSAQKELGQSELVLVPRDEPIAGVLARIDALLQRQETVGRLYGDLEVAKRCQNGLQDEVTRIHDEMQLASMIQKEFLPTKLPEVADVRFGVFFRPAGYVSGDIFDVRRLDEKTIGFFIADAVGHGVPAALITMVISRGLCMKVIDENGYQIVSPGEVLQVLNNEMIRHQYDGRRFATAVCGTINTETHEVVIAGAGHPPPILARRDGSIERITTDGSLLGIFEDSEFSEAKFVLAPGDRLILFSDGFEVAFPGERIAADGRRLPNDVYVQQFCLSAMAYTHPSEAVQRIVELVDSENGSLHQVDDLTAMIIATGVTSSASIDLTESAFVEHRRRSSTSDAA